MQAIAWNANARNKYYLNAKNHLELNSYIIIVKVEINFLRVPITTLFLFSIRSSIVNTSYGKAELHFTILFIKMLTHVQQIASFQIIRYECQIDLWFRFSFEAILSGFLARVRIHQHVNIS